MLMAAMYDVAVSNVRMALLLGVLAAFPEGLPAAAWSDAANVAVGPLLDLEGRRRKLSAEAEGYPGVAVQVDPTKPTLKAPGKNCRAELKSSLYFFCMSISQLV
jgi:hypothetical protein